MPKIFINIFLFMVSCIEEVLFKKSKYKAQNIKIDTACGFMVAASKLNLQIGRDSKFYFNVFNLESLIIKHHFSGRRWYE